MTDPLGRILTEIRDDATVAAITTRIRGGEPAPGDVKGAGEYLPFVVLSRMGVMRETRVPVQRVMVNAACYGRTFQETAALACAVSDAVHAAGPRISGSGVGIWLSFQTGGGDATTDPDTGQPREDVLITVTAATQVVA